VSQQGSGSNALTGFGPNEWLVDELYERWQKDPNSVDKAWWDFFRDYQTERGDGSTPAKPPAPVANIATGAATTAAEPQRAQAPAQRPAPPPARPEGKHSRPARESDVLPSDAQTITLRGSVARVVANMEASLEIPTATSVRAVPAKLLIDNRIVINNHLARARGGKVSFTHIIGFALVKALASLPEMNYSFAEVDGKPGLHKPERVNLGIAIDLQKDDGSRTLLVPSIKNAEPTTSRSFGRRTRMSYGGHVPAGWKLTTSPVQPSRSPTRGRSAPFTPYLGS
jgi:multifunctional 2-oxoglutarate metabolism enzyme